MNKICAFCRSPFGPNPRWPQNFARMKYCGVPCYHAGKKLSPKTADKFYWPRVEKGDGCWRWQGRHDTSGYGRYDRKGPYVYAHRIAWLFTRGEIPSDMDVLHRCDVRDCCNPEHLFLGTHTDNMLDMRRKGRNKVGEEAGRAKLTEEQVRSILSRRTGRRGEAIRFAKEYGVAQGTVGAVLRGSSWRHIPRPSPGDGD